MNNSVKDVRFLSYNLNLLPMGAMSLSTGYKVERMEIFLDEHIAKYDIVAMQEVFSTPILPNSLATSLCRQKRFRCRASEQGLTFSVVAPQPSYMQMLAGRKWTDSGLVILSRYKIVNSGFMAFANQGAHIDRGATKGCLFARVKLPEGLQHLLVFNCHLQATHTSKNSSTYDIIRDDQLREMRIFMEGVLHKYDDPHVVVGDFNVDCITCPAVGEQYGYIVDQTMTTSSRSYQHMMAVMDPYKKLKDLFAGTEGRASTRPPRLSFPRNIEAITQHRYPMCCDYMLASQSCRVASGSTKVVRFLAPAGHPFEYLSDHFGLEACFEYEVEESADDVWDLEEKDPPPGGFPTHWVIIGITMIPFLFLGTITAVTLWCVFVGFIFYKRKTIQKYFVREFPKENIVFQVREIPPDEKATEIVKSPFRDVVDIKTVRDLWNHAVRLYGWLPCCGSRPVITDGTRGAYVWASYKDVHIRCVNFCSGLLHLLKDETPRVALLSENRRSWLITDLACSLGGFVTIPIVLTAEGSFIREVLTNSKANVVVCVRSVTSKVLRHLSPSVKLVVQMQSIEYAEHAQAVEAGVQLMSFGFVEKDGEAYPQDTASLTVDPLTPWTMWYHYVNDTIEAIVVTNQEFMRSVSGVVQMGVLADDVYKNVTQHVMFSYIPLSHFHERVLHYAAFYHGIGIGFFQGEMLRIYDDMKVLKPTHLSAVAGTIQHLHHQMMVYSKGRWRLPYRLLFDLAYQMQARLLRRKMLSPILNTFFFRQLESVLGGRLQNLVIPANTHIPNSLVEFALVCLNCRVRTIASSTTHGVFLINGSPAPQCRVRTASHDVSVIFVNDVPTKYVGAWSSPTIMDFHGPEDAVLWPVPDACVVATTLEREYSQCDLILDIFITNIRNRPLVAVVVPNRDNLERWCRTRGKSCVTWGEILEHGTYAIREGMANIAMKNHFPRLHHIAGVKIHAHRFAEHKAFLTATGGLRRQRVNAYFNTVVEGLYEELGIPVSTPMVRMGTDPFADPPMARSMSVVFKSPCAVDIGGTCCKMVFFQPPNAQRLPPYCSIESKSSMGFRLGRNLHFFVPSENVAFETTEENFTGILRFVKFPTVNTPDFVGFLKEHATFETKYRQEDIERIPGTGGGAYRYQALIKSQLNIDIDQLPELQCTIRGLNFLLRMCPDEVFTYDYTTEQQINCTAATPEEHWPYLLVNIGSGVSIVKCVKSDGTYERVSGSTIGGGTFWGLCKLLTDAKSWDEIHDIMKCDGPGDEKNVDLCVGDIYGYTATELPAGLRVDTIASSFGKIGASRVLENGVKQPSNSDYVKSLLVLIANNITQIASLLSRIEGIQNIFFIGGFVENNPIVWRQVSRAMAYWARGTNVQAKFLRHDGYLGALGALIAHSTEDVAPQDNRRRQSKRSTSPPPVPTPTVVNGPASPKCDKKDDSPQNVKKE